MCEKEEGVEYHFEGAEKLLEIWFESNASKVSRTLRSISTAAWVEILDIVKCTIISQINDDEMDAYLLSESSMFVSDDRFILKTCGKTKILPAIPSILQTVMKETDMTNVKFLLRIYNRNNDGLSMQHSESNRDFFYSRKRFERPELQAHAHRNFPTEASFLDKIFYSGAAYVLGRWNVDPWYLYTVETTEDDDGSCSGIEAPDQTFEMQMTELSEEAMRPFYKSVSATGNEATKASGIDTLFENMIIDDYMFDPCGYSMNALLPGAKYITIHVTPEQQFSYVSFETNLPESNYRELIRRLVAIFKPGNFIVTLCANQESDAKDSYKNLNDLAGYWRQDLMCSHMKNYLISYARFKHLPNLNSNNSNTDNDNCLKKSLSPKSSLEYCLRNIDIQSSGDS